MLVTQTIETNANILATRSTVEQLSSILKPMPFNLYDCHVISDVFMIPHFILFLDGTVLTKDNKDIDLWECYLSDWSGKMGKCMRCSNHHDCLPAEGTEEDLRDEDSGPDFTAPLILLHEDRRQREVAGLITLLPPMRVTEPFSAALVGVAPIDDADLALESSQVAKRIRPMACHRRATLRLEAEVRSRDR